MGEAVSVTLVVSTVSATVVVAALGSTFNTSKPPPEALTIVFDTLPASAQEVRDIAGLWREAGQGDVFDRIGEAANESAFKLQSGGRKIVHVAHGTAAVSNGKPLHHRTAQRKAERRAQALLQEPWIEHLRRDDLLDAA